MNFIDIINNKKNKIPLTKEEIQFFIENLDTLPDYQISALLMAIVLNGMNEDEASYLTEFMAKSGDTISYEFDTVDKHSTGGVGDKVTLIVAPIVAALGCNVAKMSGRGLGYTGGTADKLEAIPGFKIDLDEEEFKKQIKDIGISVITQSKDVAKADKKLYALRDVTATVESIPLIAASIMSKKIASGSKNLVLDIKLGKGAFVKNINDALNLSKLMKKIGNKCGIKTRVVITNMDIPLGNNIGNLLEIKEVIEILSGKKSDLYKVSIEVAAQMVSIYKNINPMYAKEEVVNSINDGSALEKFYEFIKHQGGDISKMENKTKFEHKIYSEKDGYVNTIDAMEIGKISVLLGAGRQELEDQIDYSAGIIINKNINEYVKKGDLLATMYTNKKIDLDNRLLRSFKIGDKKIYQLIYEVI